MRGKYRAAETICCKMDLNFNLESPTNSTNFTPIDSPIDMESRVTTVIQFSVISLLGMIVNTFPVLATSLGYVKHNAVNFMVVNLSCGELLLCISFVFGQIFFVLWREWLDAWWCHFLSYIHFVAAFASFSFPPMLAVNRYIALYKEHSYEAWYSKNRSIGYLSACWGFCTIIPMIFLIAKKSGFDEDNDHCCMVVKDALWKSLYWLLINIPILCLCNVVTIFCNFKIYKKLKTHANGTTMVKNVVRENRELLYFLFADMVFPVCFHSAYHVFKFILVNRTSEFLKRFFISLVLTNSILRGIVTVAMLRPYRRAVLRLVCKREGESRIRPATNEKLHSTKIQ